MRFWLIGSGSSLNETPLELLKDEVTFTMNRAHLWYDRVDWKPSYYLMVDHNSLNPPGYWMDAIRSQPAGTKKYLWEAFRDGHPKNHPNHADLPKGVGEQPNTVWIPRCKRHHYYMATNYTKRAASWHLPDICTAFSGMSAMMQIAVLEGATEIYLLGCDLYGPDYLHNHFIPNYSGDERDRSELDNANHTHLHKVARRSSPVPIYNATPGGYLDVHPRVDIREVLNVS